MSSIVPKHDLESERAILGSMIIDSSIVAYTLNHLIDDHFYDDTNKLIYKAIRALASDDKPIDLVTVKDKLQGLDIEFKGFKGITVDKYQKDNVLENIGGVTTLVELTEATPNSSNYKEYITILIEKLTLRRLYQVSNYITSNIEKNLPSGEVLGLLEKSLKDVTSLSVRDTSISITDAILNRSEELFNSLEQEDGKVTSIKTGFKAIDILTGPLVSGNFITVGASSSIGKSMFGLNIIKNNLHNNKRILFVSLEMKYQEIVDIFITMYTDVKRDQLNKWSILAEQYYDEINIHKADGTDYSHVTKLLEDLKEKKQGLIIEIQSHMEEFVDKELYINDASTLDLQGLKQRIMELTIKEPLDLIIVDHLGLMKGEKGDSTTDRISKLSRGLKQIAGEFKTPVIALVQLLSKQIEGRPDRTPLISDIKNSSNIFEDSNIVMLLDRPSYWIYKTDSNNAPNIQDFDIHIAKNRKGKLGKVTLEANMEKQLLTNGVGFN